MARVMIPEEQQEFLSADEIAILEFTNHGDRDTKTSKHGAISIFTGKDSYYWAVAIAIATQKYEHIDEEGIYNSLATSLRNYNDTLKSHYSQPSLSLNSLSENEIFKEFLHDFLKNLDCPDINIDNIVDRTHEAFDSLVRKQLIEDPVELVTGGAVIAILGFIPYGFTTKTRRGRVVYRKITAGYWTYESKKSKGETTSNFTFRLVKFLRAFKRAFITATQEEIDKPDEHDS